MTSISGYSDLFLVIFTFMFSRKNLNILLAFYWLLLSVCSYGQTTKVVEAVKFSGIKKLNLEFLQQLVSTQPGKTLSLKTLVADEAQLRRLAAVAITSHQIIPANSDSSRVQVLFEITERRTWLPLVGVGGIEDNFWFLLGLSEFNLAGKNQTLSVQFLLNDGLPNFQVYYQNRLIRGSKWGISAEIKRAASQEPLFFPEATVDYRYANFGVGLSGIYSFTPNRHLSVGFQFFQEDYLKLGPGPLDDLPGPNRAKPLKWLTNARYESNQINYDYFYLSGYQLNASLQWVITFGEPQHFTSLILEGSKYWRPLRKINLAARLRFGISNNDPSPFVPFVLDSQFNLRGVGNRVDRGTAQLVLNLEYRQTVFSSGAWASQVVLFSDLGTWRDPGGAFGDLANPDQFRQFVGTGIRIIYNKFFLATLRLDYGVDLYDRRQRGFVLGMGQYF